MGLRFLIKRAMFWTDYFDFVFCCGVNRFIVVVFPVMNLIRPPNKFIFIHMDSTVGTFWTAVPTKMVTWFLYKRSMLFANYLIIKKNVTQ